VATAFKQAGGGNEESPKGERAAQGPPGLQGRDLRQSVILPVSQTGGYDVVSLWYGGVRREVVMAQRGHHGGAARAPLAIKAIAGHTTVNEIVRAYEIRSLQTVEWKSQTLAHLPEVLSDRWRAVI